MKFSVNDYKVVHMVVERGQAFLTWWASVLRTQILEYNSAQIGSPQ